MKPYQRITFIIGMAVVLSLMCSNVSGIDNKFTRETLRGLNFLLVQVESLKPEIERDGLTESQIQTDVELKLRLAGIKVVNEQEWGNEKGRPCLYINAHIAKRRYTSGEFAGYYNYTINVSVVQQAILVRYPDYKKKMRINPIVTTWSTAHIGETNRLNVIRDKIKDYVAKFINAYLSVNPKQ